MRWFWMYVRTVLTALSTGLLMLTSRTPAHGGVFVRRIPAEACCGSAGLGESFQCRAVREPVRADHLPAVDAGTRP